MEWITKCVNIFRICFNHSFCFFVAKENTNIVRSPYNTVQIVNIIVGATYFAR